MKRLLLLLVALAPAGCTRYEGPLEVYQKNRRGDHADLPGYTIAEQKDRGRERLTVFEEDKTRYPTAPVDGPGGVGR